MTRLLPLLLLLPPFLIPTPATASTVLPNLYASYYCRYRSLGISSADSMKAALREASVDYDDWTYLNMSGTSVRSDHLNAVIEAQKLCTGLFTP